MKYLEIFLRYFILLLVAFPNLFLFYLIFTPLTIYSSYFILKIFYDVYLNGNEIIFSDLVIRIIDACVAGSAYYLLLILNLSTPSIKFRQRIKMIFFSFLIFFIFNIIRILFLSNLLIFNSELFDFTHYLFWFFLSTLFVVLIWFYQVKIYKIKEIPFYSDIKRIMRLSRVSKRRT